MTLQKFIPEKPLAVTIRRDGRFSFNSSASRYLHELQVRRLALFGDQQTKQVELEPADPNDRTGVLVTFTRKDEHTLRASLEGHAFLDWISYPRDEARRFSLVKKEQNKLTFVAQPDSALPDASPDHDTPPKPVKATQKGSK